MEGTETHKRRSCDPLLCGAVALDVGATVIMARSPLRYRWPTADRRGDAESLLTAMTLTCRDVESASWIEEGLAGMPFARPRNVRGLWRSLPLGDFGVVNDLAGTNDALRLQFANGNTLHIHYLVELDGAITVSQQPHRLSVPDCITIGAVEQHYGWLRPDSAYRVHWNGHCLAQCPCGLVLGGTPHVRGGTKKRLSGDISAKIGATSGAAAPVCQHSTADQMAGAAGDGAVD